VDTRRFQETHGFVGPFEALTKQSSGFAGNINLHQEVNCKYDT
jgi:hypothetical protein